jgi:hypothetical protein
MAITALTFTPQELHVMQKLAENKLHSLTKLRETAPFNFDTPEIVDEIDVLDGLCTFFRSPGFGK